MKRFIAPAIALAIVATPALGQEAVEPGPAHKRIGYFAGTWTSTGEAMASPMGPGGSMSGTDTCEWFAGGFQLTCRGEMTGPRGKAKVGAVWSYDPMQQAYTYYGYSSLGDGFYVLGHVDGPVWTWKAEFPVEGAMMQMRATITEEPPSAYSYKLEMSSDGANWMLVERGRSTKKKS